MLVLSRKAGERLRIGRHITVVVAKISGNRVTLAIEAPTDVPIRRDELVSREPAEKADVPLIAPATPDVPLSDSTSC